MLKICIYLCVCLCLVAVAVVVIVCVTGFYMRERILHMSHTINCLIFNIEEKKKKKN